MKPPRFSYHDPESVSEVLELLGRYDNAKLLAGGQSLMPMLNMRFVLPDHVIDLNRIEALSYIREVPGALEIGAMTRQRDLELDAAVRARCPLLPEAMLEVGHRQTRNRGTLGGSLCHLDPAAELVAVSTALDAVVSVTGPGGTREVPFAHFPRAYMTPAVEPDEVLTGVRFPLWAQGHGYAFVEFARRHGDFAVCSATVLLEKESGAKITRASVTVAGLAPAPLRVREVEQALVGNAASEALFRDVAERCRALDAMGDVHAPASYRQQLAAVLTRRALEKANARCA
ncbi:MAG TPA: xanthine dehydrogenase family protein subunit M [Burkholderiales bacterium]|nr:xanthine dehydrogenase family protein subunit M [Burkholderiales bacterium]